MKTEKITIDTETSTDMLSYDDIYITVLPHKKALLNSCKADLQYIVKSAIPEHVPSGGKVYKFESLHEHFETFRALAKLHNKGHIVLTVADDTLDVSEVYSASMHHYFIETEAGYQVHHTYDDTHLKHDDDYACSITVVDFVGDTDDAWLARCGPCNSAAENMGYLRALCDADTYDRVYNDLSDEGLFNDSDYGDWYEYSREATAKDLLPAMPKNVAPKNQLKQQREKQLKRYYDRKIAMLEKAYPQVNFGDIKAECYQSAWRESSYESFDKMANIIHIPTARIGELCHNENWIISDNFIILVFDFGQGFHAIGYHLAKNESLNVGIKNLQSRKARKIVGIQNAHKAKIAKRKASADLLRDIRNESVTFQDSRNAGNCHSGTDNFCHMVGIDPDSSLKVSKLWKTAKSAGKEGEYLFLKVLEYKQRQVKAAS